MPKVYERRGEYPRYFWGMLKSSPFLRHNFVFFVGSLTVAALNYLFYPILGRLMAPADFGEVQALFSLFLQASIFLNILSLVTIYATVNISNQHTRNETLLSLEKLSLIIGGVILVVMLVFVGQLKTFLHFEEVWAFFALIAAFALSIPLAFRMAYLRGHKQFAKSSMVDGIGSAAKIVLAFVLVLLGFHSFGAVAGLAISQIISLGFAMAWARRAGYHGFRFNAVHIKLAALRPQLKYALAILVVSSSVTVMLSLDILAVKHYFSPEQAGLYAGMATVARIVYFLVAPVTAVLVTLVSLNQPMEKNRLQLKGSLALIVLIGGGSLFLIALFPGMFIDLLVGSKYLAYESLLPRLGIALIMLALANAIIIYQISLERYMFAFVTFLTSILTMVLIYFNHASIGDVVNSLIVSSAALLVFTILQSTYVHKN